MHYIRFLKTPKVHVDGRNIQVKAVVTVTTDLGETFYHEDVDLVATLRDSAADGEVYLRRKLQWPACARSLPINFNISTNDLEWPACLHVGLKGSTARTPGFLPHIVDVWSGELNPIKGLFDSGQRVERRFLSLHERTLSLIEDSGDSIARHLWDGSQALANVIDETIAFTTSACPLPLLEYVLVSATYRRLNVIELGCGVGTVGLSLAQSIPDCDVLLTDLPEVTSLVNANIERSNPAINSKPSFHPLDWESPLPRDILARSNDLIIVSECTYNTDTLQPLVNTLSALIARSPKAVILVSTKTRHDSEARFFDLMKAADFTQDGSAKAPLPGIPGTGYADWATNVGLYVFHGKNHRLSLSPRESEEKVPRAKAGASLLDRGNDKVKRVKLGRDHSITA